MAVDVATLVARLEADVRDFDQKMQSVQTRLGTVEQAQQKSRAGFDNMLAAGKRLAIAAGVGFGLQQLLGFIGNSINAAKELTESTNAVEKVFGDASDAIIGFGKVSATQAGLSTAAFQQLAATTGSLLQNLGFEANEAASATVTLTQRAADMASVFNTDVDQALAAINSALKGEADPIEAFGVKVNAAAVSARAIALGLTDAEGKITDFGRATATTQIIMEQTERIAGDFADTADELANSERILAAEAENLSAAFGKQIVPAKNLAVKGLGFLAQGAENLIALFDDTVRAARDTRKGFDNMLDRIKRGTPAFASVGTALENLIEKGLLTSGSFEQLASAAGLNEREMLQAASGVLRFAKETGQAQRDVDILAEVVLTLIDALELEGEELDHLIASHDLTAEAAARSARQQEELGKAYIEAANASDQQREDQAVLLAHYVKFQAANRETAALVKQKWREMSQAVDEAASEMVSLFGTAADEIEITVEEMVENMIEQLEQRQRFEQVFAELGRLGLDSLAQALIDEGPAATGAMEQLLTNMDDAFALENALDAESAAAVEASLLQLKRLPDGMASVGKDGANKFEQELRLAEIARASADGFGQALGGIPADAGAKARAAQQAMDQNLKLGALGNQKRNDFAARFGLPEVGASKATATHNAINNNLKTGALGNQKRNDFAARFGLPDVGKKKAIATHNTISNNLRTRAIGFQKARDFNQAFNPRSPTVRVPVRVPIVRMVLVGPPPSDVVAVLSHFKTFQRGGITTRPTRGIVGEAGPEAIIPLDQRGAKFFANAIQAMAPQTRGAFASSNTPIVINVEGSVVTERDLALTIEETISRLRKSGAPV